MEREGVIMQIGLLCDSGKEWEKRVLKLIRIQYYGTGVSIWNGRSYSEYRIIKGEDDLELQLFTAQYLLWFVSCLITLKDVSIDTLITYSTVAQPRNITTYKSRVQKGYGTMHSRTLVWFEMRKVD